MLRSVRIINAERIKNPAIQALSLPYKPRSRKGILKSSNIKIRGIKTVPIKAKSPGKYATSLKSQRKYHSGTG